jgi:hypothetical protein
MIVMAEKFLAIRMVMGFLLEEIAAKRRGRIFAGLEGDCRAAGLPRAWSTVSPTNRTISPTNLRVNTAGDGERGGLRFDKLLLVVRQRQTAVYRTSIGPGDKRPRSAVDSQNNLA